MVYDLSLVYMARIGYVLKQIPISSIDPLQIEVPLQTEVKEGGK